MYESSGTITSIQSPISIFSIFFESNIGLLSCPTFNLIFYLWLEQMVCKKLIVMLLVAYLLVSEQTDCPTESVSHAENWQKKKK